MFAATILVGAAQNCGSRTRWRWYWGVGDRFFTGAQSDRLRPQLAARNRFYPIIYYAAFGISFQVRTQLAGDLLPRAWAGGRDHRYCRDLI